MWNQSGNAGVPTAALVAPARELRCTSDRRRGSSWLAILAFAGALVVTHGPIQGAQDPPVVGCGVYQECVDTCPPPMDVLEVCVGHKRPGCVLRDATCDWRFFDPFGCGKFFPLRIRCHYGSFLTV